MKTGQHARTLSAQETEGAPMNYLLYIPPSYEDVKEDWPVLLFLHGSGERGEDINLVARHGPPMIAAKGEKELPFIVVSPQCPQGATWNDPEQLTALRAILDHVAAGYRVDTNRVYLTGLSLGGFGTFKMVSVYPDRFAAIAPICGGGNPATAPRFAHVPAWVFHGEADQAVPLEQSKVMVEALKRAGGDVKFTVYPKAGHNVWTVTYDNPELYTWLLDQALP